MGKFKIEHYTSDGKWVCSCHTINGDEALFDTVFDAQFALEEDGIPLDDTMRIVEVQS